jgi:hypothetical protein
MLSAFGLAANVLFYFFYFVIDYGKQTVARAECEHKRRLRRGCKIVKKLKQK